MAANADSMNSVLAMTQSANPFMFSNANTGNVLALLNTLYTSGFASHSPSHPLLAGRTMHTLYAISFIVYSLTNICDWIFVYFTLRGYVTSFPLKTWLVVTLVAIAVAGSMLTSLLLVLCVENAFAHRLDITPYRSGLMVIIEALIQWIQAFNNFRIAFLFMVLHDIPLTVLNFVFITACRCNGPQVRHWPLIMTTITTLVSILWRMVMLYFAYRRMICPLRKSSSAISLAKYPSAIEHLRANLSQKDGGRLDEYDECWPIRFSVKKVYGTNASNDAHRQNNHSHVSVIIRSRSFIISILDALLYKVTIYFSQSFHYTMFFMSFITIIVLLCLNMTLLTSVHAIGSNQFPFEISHVCVEVDLTKREITARVDSDNREHKSNATMKFVCKPFWEDGGFGVGLNRQEAGPWQTRIKISARKLLAISTQVHMNYTDRHNPHHTLLYDYAILQRFGGIRAQYDCFKGRSSEWVFKTSVDTLKWPYYIACDRSWSMQAEHLIECENRDEDTLFF
ncbi:unnamed protein product [Toxocara canis]|uniref:G_PROTEIN_RECEP_F1_2 domain-containing protein n=1 Tax=Toxocara canis TaxID=6265 RepID=A0A183V230_TOXCA|nr:unnamed protein product [Toxocara canis]